MRKKIDTKGSAQMTGSIIARWVIVIVVILAFIVFLGGKSGIASKVKDFILDIGDVSMQSHKRNKPPVTEETPQEVAKIHDQFIRLFTSQPTKTPCFRLFSPEIKDDFAIQLRREGDTILSVEAVGKDGKFAGAVYQDHRITNVGVCVVGHSKQVNQKFYDRIIKDQESVCKGNACSPTYTKVKTILLTKDEIAADGKKGDLLKIKSNTFVYYPGGNMTCFIPTTDNWDSNSKCEVHDTYLDDECADDILREAIFCPAG